MIKNGMAQADNVRVGTGVNRPFTPQAPTRRASHNLHRQVSRFLDIEGVGLQWWVWNIKRGSEEEFLVRRHPLGGALGDSVLILKPVREI